jgi:YD repeat-containing protein
VTTKNIALLFVFNTLVLTGGLNVAAQCKQSRDCLLGYCGILPPAHTCANPAGTINDLTCTWATSQCDCAPVPGPSCPSCSAPINLATGDTFIIQNDITLPGLDSGLNLTRTWNSLWPSTEPGLPTGLFGLNWRSNFEERITVGSDGLLKYSRGDGSVWSFGFSAFGSDSSTFYYRLAAPANGDTTLTAIGSNWIVAYQNGETRTFDMATGSLQSIADRNGNTTRLSYDGLGRLTTVTDSASHHLYFTYADNSSYLVTGVSSDVGLSLSYSYDGQGRLISVTKPDQTTVSFEYNSQSLISAVKDSEGKILESHTYDSQGRGLTGSKANGVDAVTVSYPKPDPPIIITD